MSGPYNSAVSFSPRTGGFAPRNAGRICSTPLTSDSKRSLSLILISCAAQFICASVVQRRHSRRLRGTRTATHRHQMKLLPGPSTTTTKGQKKNPYGVFSERKRRHYETCPCFFFFCFYTLTPRLPCKRGVARPLTTLLAQGSLSRSRLLVSSGCKCSSAVRSQMCHQPKPPRLHTSSPLTIVGLAASCWTRFAGSFFSRRGVWSFLIGAWAGVVTRSLSPVEASHGQECEDDAQDEEEMIGTEHWYGASVSGFTRMQRG